MPDISELKVQLTVTLGELRTLVGLINLAQSCLLDDDPQRKEVEPLVNEVSGLYFELMENLREGIFEDFEPE